MAHLSLKKEEIWLGFMTKKPLYMYQQKNTQSENAIKNSDYTTIVDWLWKVSLSSDSFPTDVKPANGIPFFPLIAKAVWSKVHIFKHLQKIYYLEILMSVILITKLLHLVGRLASPQAK